MSSIEYTNYAGEGEKRRVIWTDANYIGLTNEWVAELIAAGYEFIDNRKKTKCNQTNDDF